MDEFEVEPCCLDVDHVWDILEVLFLVINMLIPVDERLTSICVR